MNRLVPVALLAASILVGTILGESTVAAMSITRTSGDDATAVALRQNDDGARWAQDNHPTSAEACPEPSTLFQSACVANTVN